MDRSIAGWSERQRLAFIERLLFWRGTINRRDLCDYYGISLPQATKDLVAYTSMNPGACDYDVRKKCYVAKARMRPCLIEPDFSTDMEIVGASMHTAAGDAGAAAGGEFVLGFSRPQRTADRNLHRKLSLAACRRECVEVVYWSIRSGGEESRWISPRTFGFDGLRWHVRAFCHKDQAFKDFVLGRFASVGRSRECPFQDRVDTDWFESEVICLQANPKLSPARKRALEMDYGMEDGQLRLSVRRAMRLYTLRRLGFIKKPMQPPMLNELKELQWVAIDAGDF